MNRNEQQGNGKMKDKEVSTANSQLIVNTYCGWQRMNTHLTGHVSRHLCKLCSL